MSTLEDSDLLESDDELLDKIKAPWNVRTLLKIRNKKHELRKAVLAQRRASSQQAELVVVRSADDLTGLLEYGLHWKMEEPIYWCGSMFAARRFAFLRRGSRASIDFRLSPKNLQVDEWKKGDWNVVIDPSVPVDTAVASLLLDLPCSVLVLRLSSDTDCVDDMLLHLATSLHVLDLGDYGLTHETRTIKWGKGSGSINLF